MPRPLQPMKRGAPGAGAPAPRGERTSKSAHGAAINSKTVVCMCVWVGAVGGVRRGAVCEKKSGGWGNGETSPQKEYVAQSRRCAWLGAAWQVQWSAAMCGAAAAVRPGQQSRPPSTAAPGPLPTGGVGPRSFVATAAHRGERCRREKKAGVGAQQGEPCWAVGWVYACGLGCGLFDGRWGRG